MDTNYEAIVCLRERCALWGQPALLVLLCASFALQPWAARSTAGETVIGTLYSVILVAALVAMGGTTRLVIAALLVVIPAVALGAVGGETGTAHMLSNLIGSVFLPAAIRRLEEHQQVFIIDRPRAATSCHRIITGCPGGLSPSRSARASSC